MPLPVALFCILARIVETGPKIALEKMTGSQISG